MRRHRIRRRGVALLDALLATVILGLTTVGIISLLRQTVHSMTEMSERDRALRVASAALASVVVRDDAWLEARLGESRYRRWTLRVARESARMFHVSLADSLTGRTLLETNTYQRAPLDSASRRSLP